MKYYIFRHGQTFFSKFHIPYGVFVKSAKILSEGKTQSKRIGEYFKTKKIDAYYSSPFIRCTQTVEIIQKVIGKKFVIDKRIGEEMVTHRKEGFEDLVTRISDFLEEIKSKKFKAVAICSHGWPMAVMLAILKKGRATRDDLLSYPKAGEIVEIEAK